MAPLSIEQQFFVDRRRSKFFPILMAVMILVSLFDWYLSTLEIPPEPVKKVMTAIQTQFDIDVPKVKEPIKPKVVVKPKPIVPKAEDKKPDTKVYDLTKPVIMNAKEDKIVTTETKTVAAPRQVYGVKKVYSSGLGAGGSMSEAVVGKLGNTTDKAYDDIKATKKDLSSIGVPNGKLQGELVSTVTLTQAPSFKKRVQAEVTPEIKASGISGTIKIKILVDVDGLVKQAIIQNDLGFGTAESALKACLQMEFVPAMRGSTPVAVWIIIPVKFEKIA